MPDSYEKAVDRALEIRREIMHEIKYGKLSRRDVLRRMLMAGGAFAAVTQLRGEGALAASDEDPAGTGAGAPATRPYIESLVHVNRAGYLKQPETLSPEPTGYAQTAAGGVAEINRPNHQAWSSQWAEYPSANRKTYRVRQRARRVSFHRDLPEQDCWSFDDKVPGPTFHSRYGVPAIVRVVNELPTIAQHVGYGLPETTTHLHNAHTPSESDGNPLDYMPRQAELNGQNDYGRFRDHHYPNVYAGGDPREALGTLWYHDHRHDFTAPNVYRGLAGFHLMFDEVDSGNENDSNLAALRLPSGEYDVPLMIVDVLFDRSGRAIFNQFDFDGHIGNKYLVNGKVQPKFRVEPRKYRLRLLNGSVSRTYGLALVVSDSATGPVNAVPLTGASIIATDGNLLPAPLPLRTANPLGASQRLDVIVDFAKVPQGKYVYLVNRWAQSEGREPDGTDLGTGPDGPMYSPMPGAGHPLMRFDRDLPYRGDPSRLPATLRALPWQPNDALSKLSVSDIRNAIGQANPFPGVARVREWRFDRTPNGMWTVNSQLFDSATPAAVCGKDTGEIWLLQSGGGWIHPVHLHYEEHRTLFRNGMRPEAQHREYGRSDTLLLAGEERAVIYRKFREFTGKYVMHCHNLVHEDHAMMIRFDVV